MDLGFQQLQLSFEFIAFQLLFFLLAFVPLLSHMQHNHDGNHGINPERFNYHLR